MSKDLSKQYYIYVLYFGNNYVYVGSTNDTNRRINSHLKQLQSGIHYNQFMQRVYNKYGLIKYEVQDFLVSAKHCIGTEQLVYDEFIGDGYKVCNLFPPVSEKVSIATKKALNTPEMHKRLSDIAKYNQSLPHVKMKHMIATKEGLNKPGVQKRKSESIKANYLTEYGYNAEKRSIAASEFRKNATVIERYKNISTFKSNHGTSTIFKYLEPTTINEFTFEDWHHFIIQKNGNVIVFLWDTRKVVFQCSQELLKDGYAKITKLDSYKPLNIKH
jgi:hypothetical protein